MIALDAIVVFDLVIKVDESEDDRFIVIKCVAVTRPFIILNVNPFGGVGGKFRVTIIPLTLTSINIFLTSYALRVIVEPVIGV